MPRCPHCNGKRIHTLKKEIIMVDGTPTEIELITCPSILRVGKKAAHIFSAFYRS